MPDISMCEGQGCDKKYNCYRYMATPSEYRQAYFMYAPVKDGECNHYVPLVAEKKLD